MRTLVTGGTGFIGSNLANALLDAGHEVLITGLHFEDYLPNFKGVFLRPSFIGLDWRKIGKVDVLFHEAAITDTTVLDREEMFRVNVEGPKELFESAVSAGCRRIVYASSTAVYGNIAPPYREDGPVAPMNPYAESKLALDEFAMKFAEAHPETVVIGLRYCNVYGPGESRKMKTATMIWQLAQQMVNGNPRLFKYGEQKRDYIYIKDVVRANLLAMDAKESGIFNCGSGKATSFNELVAILNKVLGTNRKPVYIDNPYAERYQTFTLCDMSRAKEKLGFVPEFDIERGIADYYKSGFLVTK